MKRGNKLWEGHRMVIPEHRAYMVEKEIRESRFVERPDLDEDKLKEMSFTVSVAIENQSRVTLTVYDPMGFQSVELIPTRLELDRLKGWNNAGRITAVPLGEILDVVIAID
ncbi:MAG: YolD-like family protein [Tumebacillaceae bacterium]